MKCSVKPACKTEYILYSLKATSRKTIIPSGGIMKKPHHHISVLLLSVAIAGSCLLQSCAFGTAKIKLQCGELPKPPQKQSGIVKIEKFVDARPAEYGGDYIGYKRNGFGATVGRVAADSTRIDTLITGFFARSLANTGYTVITDIRIMEAVADNTSVPILTGKITKCWLDMYMAVNAQVTVDLALYSPDKKDVLWKSTIDGEKVNVLWWGAKSEYEKVFTGAFQYLLDTAQQKFSTEEFRSRVNLGK